MEERLIIYGEEENIALNASFFREHPEAISTSVKIIERGVASGEEITEQEFWEIHEELNE